MTIQDLISNPQYPQKIILQRLICHFLNISRENIWTNANQEISNPDLEKIISWYNAYVNDSKPLDYIIGYVEFFWNKFIVNQDTIVPRPETEYMINAVTEYCNLLKQWDSETMSQWNILLDIGTWSWVLWISVLLQNPDTFQTAFLTDYSQDALKVAKQNYQNLILNADKNIQTQVEFIHSDLLAFITDSQFSIPNPNIILLGNLPYIPEKTHDENNPDSVKKREPRMAFVWGDDGLIYYYKMFDKILDLKKTMKQLNIVTMKLFLEMMTWQVDILRSKYSDFFVFEEVKTFHFNIRIVKVWFK